VALRPQFQILLTMSESTLNLRHLNMLPVNYVYVLSSLLRYTILFLHDTDNHLDILRSSITLKHIHRSAYPHTFFWHGTMDICYCKVPSYLPPRVSTTVAPAPPTPHQLVTFTFRSKQRHNTTQQSATTTTTKAMVRRRRRRRRRRRHRSSKVRKFESSMTTTNDGTTTTNDDEATKAHSAKPSKKADPLKFGQWSTFHF